MDTNLDQRIEQLEQTIKGYLYTQVPGTMLDRALDPCEWLGVEPSNRGANFA